MGKNTESEQTQKLKKQREQILLDLERLSDVLKSEVDADADEGDPDLVEHEKTLALVKTLEHSLLSVDYALRQSQEGRYGICEGCGEPIDPDRLEALPEATLCVNCKSLAERNLRRSYPAATRAD